MIAHRTPPDWLDARRILSVTDVLTYCILYLNDFGEFCSIMVLLSCRWLLVLYGLGMIRKGPNQGRQFYCCPRADRSEQCNIFVWLDESNGAAGSGRGASSFGSGGEGEGRVCSGHQEPCALRTVRKEVSGYCSMPLTAVVVIHVLIV